MPQIQQGQMTPGQNGAPQLYGTQKTENSIPFQERLMRLFKPHEFVTIKNITADPLYWQYLPAENEHEAFSEDGMQRIITRENPELWMVVPGETEVLVGASAYRALDVMYKNYSASRTLSRFNDPASPNYDEKGKHLPKNFNFADSGAQDEFIKLAYIGKATMVFDQQTTAPVPENVPAQPSQPEPTPEPVQEDEPQPGVTEGAPLEAPSYAEPDVTVAANKVKSMKELSGANAKK